jgi:hypothetical protein
MLGHFNYPYRKDNGYIQASAGMCIPGNSFVGGFIPVLIAQASF